MRKRIFLIAAIVWMAVIFYFSARQGEDSSKDSSRAGVLILSLVKPGFRSWPEEEQLAYIQTISHPLRKTAHATEYAVLAVLLFGALLPVSPAPAEGEKRLARREKSLADGGKGGLAFSFFAAWVIAAAYASGDELHQLFVPGRACSFRDVCIDSAGAFAGLLLAAGYVHLRRRKSG